MRRGNVERPKLSRARLRRMARDSGPARALARRRHYAVVLGDSHARVFLHPLLRRSAVGFEVHAVRGLTLSGLPNPSSSSGGGQVVDAAVAGIAAARRRPDAIVIVMGEVDCGFVLWWRHEQKGEALEPNITRALDNLRDLLERCSALAETYVVSVPLPTLANNTDFGEYADLRRQIQATQEERTELVRRFNQRAAAVCEETGARFVDLDDACLGPDGLVSGVLRNPDPTDHHYDPVVYARLLERTLIPLVSGGKVGPRG